MAVQERWSSIWGHLEDLRQTLLYSLVVIGVGFFASLAFYQPLFEFLTVSLYEQTVHGLTKERVLREQISNPALVEQWVELPSNTRLISAPHEAESRLYRLPPGESLVYERMVSQSLLILSPLEGIALVFKSCFWLSLALTSPIWGWIWLRFILPGLKPEEQRAFVPFLSGSFFALAAGVSLAYYVTLPVANAFLSAFNQSLGENAWTLKHYIDYVLVVCAGHIIAAELALLLFVLVHFRLITAEGLINKRYPMIVVAFVLGALLTPPDVLTQLLLAFPLVGLYELAILYAKWRGGHAMRFFTSP